MSFATSTYPNAKVADMFSQQVQNLDSDFFDEFLTFGPDDDNVDCSNIPGSTCNGSNSTISSSLSTDDEIHFQSWAGESWILPENSDVESGQSKQFYNELSGRAAISDSELLCLENITLESPQIIQNGQSSLPSSPMSSALLDKLRRKNRIVESLSKSFKKAHKSVDMSTQRSPIRKSSQQQHSPKLSRSLTDNEAWSKKLDIDTANFTFELKQNALPLSPPPSAKLTDSSMNNRHVDPRQIQGFAYRTPSNNVPASYNTPTTTPRTEMPTTPRTPRLQRHDSAAFPTTPQSQHSRVCGTPNGTVFPGDIESPLWWSNASSSPLAQPSPAALHMNPQRASKTLASQLSDTIYHTSNHDMFNPMNTNTHGLMIQMPQQQHSPTISGHPYVLSAPALLNTPQCYFPTQRLSRTRPYSSAAKSTRTRSSSPSSDSASPRSPTNRVRKRKSSKRQNSMGAGMASFVNYTPDDSRKILTGVAPSGSSKTKARREKEAEDKRRRLSMAAMRAVRAAGGDVGSLGLAEEGLFV